MPGGSSGRHVGDGVVAFFLADSAGSESAAARSTLYVGQISTSGRAEVTALGDEVNEGARIEACAPGGRVLASKELLERLDPEDAVSLALDPDGLTYTPLADLATATEKARRDAPAIAVCEV